MKTNLFCETSVFKGDNIKNERILRDFRQKWKVQCRADGLVPMRFVIFPVHLSKSTAWHEKMMPGHTKCCTCHAKSSQQTWRSEAPKRNPSKEISARTSSQLWWTCLLYCTCHWKCKDACHGFGKCPKSPTSCALLTRCTIPCSYYTYGTCHTCLLRHLQHLCACLLLHLPCSCASCTSSTMRHMVPTMVISSLLSSSRLSTTKAKSQRNHKQTTIQPLHHRSTAAQRHYSMVLRSRLWNPQVNFNFNLKWFRYI